MRRKYNRIYHSEFHLIATIFIVLIPFAYLLLFSQIAQLTSGVLINNLFTSIGRLFAAYVLALVVGSAAAMAFFRGRRAAIALPIFDVLQSLPVFALLPLAVSVWGPRPAIVIAALVAEIIWPIFFTVVSNLKLVKHDWEEAVEIFGLRDWDYFTHFILPVSLPGIITGSIIGLGEAWEALVGAEIIIGVKSGVGNFFEFFAHNSTITAFGIFGLLLIIFSINKLIWIPLLEWSHRIVEE